MIGQPHFNHRDGHLHCEDVPASRLADEYGTPCYVYSASALRERYRSISEAFSRWDPLVCFSVKSCGNLAVLNLLRECGSGFDVVSGGELHRALAAGADPESIVFAGVGKTRAEIRQALEAGIGMFNVESAPELRAIRDVAGQMGETARVALRINPDVDPKTHAKTTTGKKENKFGMGFETADELLSEAAKEHVLDVRGVHVHLGSPIYSTEPYEKALEKVCRFVEEQRRWGHTVDTMNLGGGYCMSYTGEDVIGPEDYAEAAEPYLEELDCRLILEPGRYVAANSGILLTDVTYRKVTEHGKKFLICDGGMNDLLRPTLYDAFHGIWPVDCEGGMPDVLDPDADGYDGWDTEVVDVVGPVCESGDYFGKKRALPRVEGGDMLAVFSVGAYGFTMASNYNSRPRPPEVLVEDGESRLVRPRESYDDLVEPEKDLI